MRLVPCVENINVPLLIIYSYSGVLSGILRMTLRVLGSPTFVPFSLIPGSNYIRERMSRSLLSITVLRSEYAMHAIEIRILGPIKGIQCILISLEIIPHPAHFFVIQDFTLVQFAIVTFYKKLNVVMNWSKNPGIATMRKKYSKFIFS